MTTITNRNLTGWIIFRYSQNELTPERYEVLRFIEEAKKQNIDIKVIRPDQIDLLITSEDRKSIILDGETTSLPDFVLPRMGASTTYHALAVIRHLERMGVHCINTSMSIENVKDKLFSQQILAEANIPTPKTMLAKLPINVSLVKERIGFPAVIKTLSGSLGKGVFLANTENEFKNLMDMVEVTNSKANMIIQEMITDSYGTDLRVFVIGGRAVAAMQRTAPVGDFKANYSAGGSVHSYELTPEVEWLAVESARLLGLDIAGVDLLFDGDHFKICEVNSSPGFEGLEKACPNNIASEIIEYIKIRFGLY
jgi:gamma-F420-2:alpha-L-glutamate ligase